MKFKHIATLVLAGVLSQSCSDFLKEEPKDEFSVGQYFSDPDHATNAVNSLYRNGAPQMYEGGVYSGTRMMWIQYMTGLFDNEYRGQEIQIQRVQQLNLDATNITGYLDPIWRDFYIGISRANNAIKYIPGTPNLSTENANRLLGEARFFRAYNYYFLTRMFGEVPLLTEPVESLDNLYIERSSVADIYNLIVEDLRFALEQGGLSTSHMGNNNFRITQGVVATLLAEVYLTMGGYPLQQEERYADAATIARNLINGQYGSYALEQHNSISAYNKIRMSDVSPEYIYFKEFLAGISNSPNPQWAYPVGMVSYTKYTLTNGAYQPLDEYVAMYDPEEDLRIQNKQYFHWTFDTPEGEVTFELTPYMWHDDAALLTGPPNSSKDVPIYSYADVLLIAAEAIAHSEGVTEEAANYLAQVRGRAYWQQSFEDVKASVENLPVNEFIEEVWTERYRELVFEFHGWFDMQRTRKYPVADEQNPGSVTYVNLVGHTTPLGSTYQEKHLLFPISQNEIQRNPSLGENNPGY